MFGLLMSKGNEIEANLEVQKLTQMLDNISNIVMLCDTTHENSIFYMNRAAKETIGKYRDKLNEGLGGRADVANAMDNSIHQFHKNPDRIRGIFAQPKALPNSADIPLGGVTFRTRTYPIWDTNDSNKVLCYMACWEDVTAEKEMEDGRIKEQIEKKKYLETRIEQISVAMEEMSATVLEVATNANQASESTSQMAANSFDGQKVVNEAIDGMRKVGQVVRNASDIVDSLGNKSEKIGEIVDVINGIADQTNLLALNAAIEAARAGEHGRGFAVVADEVRKLSESTAAATKEIEKMIKEIQSETSQAVSAMEEGCQEVTVGEDKSSKAGEALDKIINDIASVKDVITQIATATEEQSTATEEISKNIEELAQRS